MTSKQMGYGERIKLYRECETLRGNPLIVYVTSIRPNISSQMSTDSIPSIIAQIEKIPSEKDNIDLLIISNGGDPITSLRIISILRERFKKITVLVPYVAYSAATVLALGADEIVMHPYSNLGPVDPQLTISRQNEIGQPSQLNFSSEDIRNYIEFIKKDVGITDQTHLIAAFNSLSKEVGPLPIGSAKRSQQLSLSLSEKMLETHMDDKSKANSIAKSLNSSYYHHGYAVSRAEAKAIGLNVINPDQHLENLLWEIWQSFDNEMHCSSQFNPISEIMNDPIAKEKVSNIPVVSLPANTPLNVAQNIIANVAQQNAQITQQTPIEIQQLLASIESVNCAYEVKTILNIAYWREVNMQLSVNVTGYSNGWERVEGEKE